MNKVETAFAMKKNIIHEINEQTPGPAMQFFAPLNPTIQRAKAFQKNLALKVKNSLEQ
jgi:hypothetical protein